MSAEVLRRAAALMREHAATESILRDGDPYYALGELPDGTPYTEMSSFEWHWSPVVALAVADWLEATAFRIDRGRRTSQQRGNHSWRGSKQALAVAHAYLGDQT